jgi:hypothetical protein
MTLQIEISERAQRRLAAIATIRQVDISAVVEDLVENLPDDEARPNIEMLAALRDIEEWHKDRPFTDGSRSQQLIREARGGAMFGYEHAE